MAVKIVSFDSIEIISIVVAEQINTTNLKSFIKTNLELNNIYSYKNKKIHVSYIHELKEYQISIIHTSCIPIFYIFANMKMDTSTVFICNDFFVLYKNLKPYYFKKIENNTSTQDIKTYIQSKLNLGTFQVQEVSNEQLNIYTKNYKTNKYKYEFIYLDNNKSFLYYVLYVILVFLCFIYFFDNITNNNMQDNNSLQVQKELLSKLESIKKDKQFKYISKTLVYIFENEKKFHINIQSISYNNNKINILVTSAKKNQLFNFLTAFSSSNINNIHHEKNKYILNATISPAK